MAKNYMIGNWKMNQSLEDIKAFFHGLELSNNQNNFWIAPQTLHLSFVQELASLSDKVSPMQRTGVSPF